MFKLEKGESQRIHPMAFEFPAQPAKDVLPHRAYSRRQDPRRAEFDHALYIQPDRILNTGWKESRRTAGMFLKADKVQGLVDPPAHLHAWVSRAFKNEDVIV